MGRIMPGPACLGLSMLQVDRAGPVETTKSFPKSEGLAKEGMQDVAGLCTVLKQGLDGKTESTYLSPSPWL